MGEQNWTQERGLLWRHKRALGDSSSAETLEGQLMHQGRLTSPSRLCCVVHCFDLSHLEAMFGVFLRVYHEDRGADAVVTFREGEKVPEYLLRRWRQVTYLRAPQKGGDIGGFCAAVRHLQRRASQHRHLLFVQSKSNAVMRHSLLTPFLWQADSILSQCNGEDPPAAIVPPFINCGETQVLVDGEMQLPVAERISTGWGRNKLYMRDACDLLELDHDFGYFSVGNFYCLRRDIAEALYCNPFLTEGLNSPSSFDTQWVRERYGLHAEPEARVRDWFQAQQLPGNNFATGLGWRGLADCMVEHIFERLPLALARKAGGRVEILEASAPCNRNRRHIRRLTSQMLSETTPALPELTSLLLAAHPTGYAKIEASVNLVGHLVEEGLVQSVTIVTSEEGGERLRNELLTRLPHLWLEGSCLSAAQAAAYMATFPDLAVCQQDASEHWRTFGIREGRSFCLDGNPIVRLRMRSVPNDQRTVCYSKWLQAAELEILKEGGFASSHYIVANDSFLTVGDLSPLLEKHWASCAEVTGLIDSHQGCNHLPDFLRVYRRDAMPVLLARMREVLPSVRNVLDAIRQIEMRSHDWFAHREVCFATAEEDNRNPHFVESLMMDLLGRGYPIVKIKYILEYSYPQSVCQGEELPLDFEGAVYVSLHPDLEGFSAEEATAHFLAFGAREGRRYRFGQEGALRECFWPWLEKLGLHRTFLTQ